MKIRRRSVRALNMCWFCLLLGTTSSALALAADAPGEPPLQDGQGATVAENEEPSSVDTYNVGSFFLGYSWLEQDGEPKAAEYQYPHSSLTLGIDTLACPLPHRYHLFGEYRNEKDFYADAGYAYKDLLLFRDILVGIHHELGHYDDYLFADQTPSLFSTDRDPGDSYAIDYASNLFSLRLKAPDFPFHTFVKQRRVEHDGDIEERFQLGTFGSLNKVSQSRSIDWTADTLTLGANSHLGQVEAEYQYDYSQFDPGGGNVLYDYYPAFGGQPADIYPHNVEPETESHANSLKMHTSYTGGIVAGATLSNLQQKNNYSQTESGVWKGAFDFRWLPDPVLGFFFKYRHKDLDLDQNDMVQLVGAANVLSYPVRQGVSYDKDQFSLVARYKPLGRLTVLPSYEFSTINRKDIDEWAVLPETTDVHTLNLTAQARPFDTLKVKGLYEYKYYDDPAYNTEPDYSNQVRLNTTYTPLPWLSAFLDYVVTETRRDDLRYTNLLPAVLLEGGQRDGRSDRLTASLAFTVSAKTTVTGSWTYSSWDVEQDLAFAGRNIAGGALAFFAHESPYCDQANTYSLSLQYVPREDITITAEGIHTLSSGEYTPEVATIPLSLGSYSPLDARETLFSVEVAKKMPKDWELGIRFYADSYDDQSNSQQDGDLYVTTFMVKRYF